jgi:hypothetical protein
MLSTSPLGTSDLLSCCLIAIGLVDASVVVLAEDLGIRRLATRDVRHFATVRLRDGTPFDLVVHPSHPDD